MPKSAKPPAEWRAQLQLYAAKHKDAFQNGGYPNKNTQWGKEREKIDSCPFFQSSNGKDLLGNILECTCGYSHKKRKTDKVAQTDTESKKKKVSLPLHASKLTTDQLVRLF